MTTCALALCTGLYVIFHKYMRSFDYYPFDMHELYVRLVRIPHVINEEISMYLVSFFPMDIS